MKSIIDAKKRAKSISKEQNLKQKEALELVANEHGYDSWKAFKDAEDVFWYHKASPFLTQWFTTYREAKDYQKETSGYLLTYKGQYFVVDEAYIEHLGIPATAPVWDKIDRDVNSPESLEKIYDLVKKLGILKP